MSAPVRLHEPVCFDNMQNQFFWIDHFLGDQLKDEWNAGGSVGSATVVDQQAGGIVRIATGATLNDWYVIYWNHLRSLLVTKRVAMETRTKLTQTTNVRPRLELLFDASNRIRFGYDSGVGANWFIYCRDAGGAQNQDSGTAADTSYHRFRVQCEIEGGNHIHYYIDGTQTSNSPLSANVPTNHLQPYLYIQTLENLAKSMDTDYVVVRQDI